MKKVLIGLFSMIAGLVMAENIVDVVGNQHDRIWPEMQKNISRLANGGTLTNGLTVSGTTALATVTASGKVTSVGRATVTAPSTSSYMMEMGTATMSAGQTTMTNTFATTFTATPVVLFDNSITNGYTITYASNLFTIAFGATNQTAKFIAVGLKSN